MGILCSIGVISSGMYPWPKMRPAVTWECLLNDCVVVITFQSSVYLIKWYSFTIHTCMNVTGLQLICKWTLMIPVTCFAFTNHVWEADKWPAFVKVNHSDDFASIGKWQMFFQMYQLWNGFRWVIWRNYKTVTTALLNSVLSYSTLPGKNMMYSRHLVLHWK